MLITRQLFFIVLILLIDFYFFQRIKSLIGLKKTFRKLYVTNTIFSVLFTLSIIFLSPEDWNKNLYLIPLAFIFTLTVSKIFACFYFLITDLKTSLFRKNYAKVSMESRRKFISKIGLGVAAIPFVSLLFGMLKTAFDYEIVKQKISFKNLPKAFQAFKILQISDIHAGSFLSAEPLKKAVELINAQNADLIVFTGDLVNYKTDEVYPFIDVLSQLKAKHGVISILGNHDYGDYMNWKSDAEKNAEKGKMKTAHAKMGWNLLCNEHLMIEKNEDKIAIIGVENWSAKGRFKSYGDLKKATENLPNEVFKIVLSHDPTHWDAEIIPKFKEIDLTLSGHTHGGQIGIFMEKFKLSPAQIIFEQWAGLYRNKNQFLYVNRGLGFVGYNGRLGIKPEITVFSLEIES